MNNDRKKLLISAILMFVYTLGVCLYEMFKNTLITDNKLNNIANIIQIIISIVGIVYFIILSLNKKIDLDKQRRPILIFSIIFFIINIISGIFGFIVYGNLKPIKKEKRELPKLEDVEDYNKYIYLPALAFCLLIIFYLSGLIPSIIYACLCYVSIIVILVFLFKNRLKRDFKVFREYFKEYSKEVFKTWLKSFTVLLILGIVISITTGLDSATNQENLNKMFKNYPLFVAMLAMIYAPISEELMFRGIFKKFIKNKWAFILISGFTFGIIHVIDDFQSYKELLFIFTYSTLGCYMASLYYKTNNICTNIMFHFMQNTLSIIAMVLMQFVK